MVKDSSGAVIPAATLTVHNVHTGQTRTAVTDARGSYRFSSLQVGDYEILVEHPGFQTERRTGLTLAVGQEGVVDFALVVGAVTETIVVTEQAPLVNTTTSSLGGLVDERTVADLPLNGRNYMALTMLQPGVSQHRYSTDGSGYGGPVMSVNGAPVRSNNYLLDGASMVSFHGFASGSQAQTTLGVEGIREWRVVTNSFSAEYGMTMGGQMEIVTKSGTNAFHGSLFEYLRNSALDARNFFDYKSAASNRRLPAFTRNNFGVALGGPIKKDKTFIFGVYEGLKERLGPTIILDVIPSAAKTDGGLVPQIAPVIKPLLTLFPDPNLPNSQYTFPASKPTNEHYGQVRIDHTFSTNDSLFGRYTFDDTEQTKPISYPQLKDVVASRAQFATISESRVFSPNLLNTIRFSYSRTKMQGDSPRGIIGPQFSFVPGQEIGWIFIGGLSRFIFDINNPLQANQNIFAWSDDLFYNRGRHALKFGALINQYQQFISTSTWAPGRVDFADTRTFLLGRPLSYFALTPGSITDRTFHYKTLGFYIQDDLRVRSNLTLNLGLRYEFRTDIQEVRGRGSALRDILHDRAITLGATVVRNPSLRNLSPRFGFAWDVMGDGKLAVRGGFGLLYDITSGLGTSFFLKAGGDGAFATQSEVLNPPTLTIPFVFPPEAIGKSLEVLDYNLQQPHMLQYNLTVERQLPFDMGLKLSYAGSRGINLIQFKEGNPTEPQILPDGRKFWTGNELRTNPYWARMRLNTAAGNSWYNSLQVVLTKRLSKGLQFQSSYTWSKLIDETQGQSPGEIQLSSDAMGSDPSDRKVDRGLAAFDIAHNWSFSTIYHLPESQPGGALSKLLNGWWISTILSMQSGAPFNPRLVANRSRSKVHGGAQGDRPNWLPGRSKDSVILGGPNRYFDPTAFALQPAGFLGNAGRNILRGPGLANLDFSLVKDTTLGFLGESGKLQFRAEFFNLLNRANFALSNGAIFAGRSDAESPLPTAGRITSTITPSRQIQFALKIIF
ncbi:MAG: TonB-dependent receptor [Acidobacteria bacterium]|nr:TonB-dependent receptor [Acidobacteriota bacterium]